ncbi:dethiobiotin synthase [Sphingobacterium sp. HJSM2_6]|uniref:dethiobiotin synthase n=1 Tax=Sphingobacterium sp. HJSM2_6 TaxID=3366264 RepID=UPI003BE3D929
MIKGYFITGIGTSVGKTVVSAMLAMHWNTAYWKPIQSGDIHQTDSQLVALLSQQTVPILPEVYKLQAAESPHYAAELQAVHLNMSQIKRPDLEQGLLIEGAGGVYVPINEQYVMLDLMKQLDLPIILVCRDYLGCINHTLLSIQAIRSAGLALHYLVFNGNFKESSSRIIKQYLPSDCKIIVIPALPELNEKQVREAIPHIKIY